MNHPSSFRDPAGFIFTHRGQLYRQINFAGQSDFDFLLTSGLYKKLVNEKLLIAHSQVKKLKLPADKNRYKIIKPQPVTFISYPYEWSFSQLKDAALLTLKVQKLALGHGMILKDASAYNVQFKGRHPILIDTLSFKKYEKGNPWEGYKQFCEHFLAPLALASYVAPEISKSLTAFVDGIPLKLAARMLPSKARLNRGLLAHLFVHSAMQQKFQAKGQSTKPDRRLSPMALNGLIAGLERAIKKLNLPGGKTEWGNYYASTNYSPASFNQKKKIVSLMLSQIKPVPKLVWDLGANNGEFSKLAAGHGAYTVAFDIDPKAVNLNYQQNDKYNNLILPLAQDFTNPSPAIGWHHKERQSLTERGPADVALALALIHHLAITGNLPLGYIAEFMSSITNYLIIEFVPKEDSKVQLLLASRKDIFDEYAQQNFEEAFARCFKLIDSKPIKGSRRRLYLYEKD